MRNCPYCKIKQIDDWEPACDECFAKEPEEEEISLPWDDEVDEDDKIRR